MAIQECADAQWLKNLLAQLVAYPVDQMTDDSDLRTDLGLDSSDLLFIQLAIEDKTGKPLEYDDDLQIHTIGDLRRSLETALTKAA